MPRPNREEFILDVRRATASLPLPDVQTDSSQIDTDLLIRSLSRCDFWLTPRVVEKYAPSDFATSPEDLRQRLDHAVNALLQIASQVPADQPATREQYQKGLEAFGALTGVLGDIVRQEWLAEIDQLEKQTEQWAAQSNWNTRRETKKMSETLLGSYETTQLLIFAAPNLYVLDPVARFLPAAQGAFDLAVQPSYQVSSMYRDDHGKWFVHLHVENGITYAERVEWNQQSFRQCVEQLGALV